MHYIATPDQQIITIPPSKGFFLTLPHFICKLDPPPPVLIIVKTLSPAREGMSENYIQTGGLNKSITLKISH